MHKSAGDRPAVCRSRTESKSLKMAELKRMADLMLSHIAILEGECSSPSGASSAGSTPVAQQEVMRVNEQRHSRSWMASTSTQTQRAEEEEQAEAATIGAVPQELSGDGGAAMAVLEAPAVMSDLAMVPGVTSSGGGTIAPGITQSTRVWPWVTDARWCRLPPPYFHRWQGVDTVRTRVPI